MRYFAIFCLCFLFLSLGVVSAHYKTVPYNFYKQPLMAMDAWLAKRVYQKEADQRQIRRNNMTRSMKVVTYKKGAYEGYTLFTTYQDSVATLIDMDGEIVHRWHMPFHEAWPNAPHISQPLKESAIYTSHAYVYPNGDLIVSYHALGDTPYGYGAVKIDKDSNIIWRYAKNTHHDFYVSDNGNIYFPSQYFTKGKVPGLEQIPTPALVDEVSIVSPEGKELEVISVLDAFKGTPYESWVYNKSLRKKINDPTHLNHIMRLEESMAADFPQFAVGDMLISLRNIDTIAVIDGQTKKIKWAAKGPWNAQHAARFLPNGHIMLFDNRGYDDGRRTYSRVLEIDPQNSGTVWKYDGLSDPFYTKLRGAALPLPNDNVLVMISLEGRAVEINRNHEVLWELQIEAPENDKEIQSMRRIPYDALTFLPKRTNN